MADEPSPTRGSDARQDHQGQRTFGDLQNDVKQGDCWLVVNDIVYDATDFLKLHPGEPGIVLKEAGPDATRKLASLRSPVDPAAGMSSTEKAPTSDDAQRQLARKEMPAADGMVLLEDFEFWAQKVLDKVAWAYYRSAADQERTYDGSMEALRRYFFRPRMLRDMSKGSTQTSFLKISSELPIYIAPAAMAKLGDPLGEVNLTKAAAHHGIVYSVSANSSCSLKEIFEAKEESQTLLYQIYIDEDRRASEDILRKVDKLGAKAIILTADVGWESKRTLESRTGGAIPKSCLGTFMAEKRLQDRKLSFGDISWIRLHTKLPIIVKGLLSIEDVELCVKHRADGVMISNHGGRQVDYSPAPIDILYEIRTYRPDLFDEIDIMIDGGVRSGADVVKMLAMGAKAVGFGRTFLYANATHGEAGVKRAIEILRQEIINTMRNIGAATISDLKPEMVGPVGPWVGANRPSYVRDWKLWTKTRSVEGDGIIIQ